MSPQWDEMDVGEETWITQLLEARQRARNALSECAVPEVNNWRAVNSGRLVQYLHSQTMDYHRHVAPKSEGITDGLWTEPLTFVEVPASGTVDAGMTDWYGTADIGSLLQQVDWEEKPVQLDTLRQEWQEQSSATVEAYVTNRATGEQSSTHKRYDLHLPPAASEMVIAQLDRCIDNLGWTPDAEEISIGEDDIEVRY